MSDKTTTTAAWVPDILWDDGEYVLAFRLMGEDDNGHAVILNQWPARASRYEIAGALRKLANKLEHWGSA
jgi:hypothetical protein